VGGKSPDMNKNEKKIENCKSKIQLQLKSSSIPRNQGRVQHGVWRI
jgi:hypothetical protein